MRAIDVFYTLGKSEEARQLARRVNTEKLCPAAQNLFTNLNHTDEEYFHDGMRHSNSLINLKQEEVYEDLGLQEIEEESEMNFVNLFSDDLV